MINYHNNFHNSYCIISYLTKSHVYVTNALGVKYLGALLLKTFEWHDLQPATGLLLT